MSCVLVWCRPSLRGRPLPHPEELTPGFEALDVDVGSAAALFGATDLMALLRQPPAGPCYAAAFDVVWRRADQALSDWLSRIGA